MRKINWPLLFGSIIIIFILIVMAFPTLFTHINPYGADFFRKASMSNGRYVLVGAPFAPSKEFILGSDELGRDVFSLIIYGTRLTMILGFFTVLGRFIIAIPLGIGAGFGSRICKTIINQFSITFSAIPALVISIIVLKMNFFTSLYKRESIIAFVIVLTIVGWAKLAQLISERVEAVLSRAFITGETAIGKNKIRIALENVVPHLSPELVILFFMEFATALGLIMQLGIFGVFVGNLRVIEGSDTMYYANMSFEPEWASMLGAANSNIVTAPWILISPAAAFFISIFGLNLFGEGIRKILQKRDSMFIPRMRRALSFEKGDFRLSNLNPVKGKFRLVTIVVIIMLCFLAGNTALNSRFNFKAENVSAAAIGSNHKEVIVGTKESEEVALKLAGELKANGFKPLENNSFIVPYSINNKYLCYQDKVSLICDNSKKRLAGGNDFSLYSYGDFNVSGKIYDASFTDMFSFKNYSVFNDRFVLLDGNVYSPNALSYFAENIMEKSKAKGILYVNKNGTDMPGLIGEKALGYPVLWVSGDTAREIQNSKDAALEISLKTKKIGNIGRNVMGILPGSDTKLSEKAIIIGLSYNYMNKDMRFGIDRERFEIELIKKLASSKRNKSVIVAFWDGTLSDDCNGAKYYSLHQIYEPEHTSLYIDLTKIKSDKTNIVYFNSDLAPIASYSAWAYSHDLRTGIENTGTEIKKYDKVRSINEALATSINVDEAMYYDGKIPTVIIATGSGSDGEKGKFTFDDLGKIVFKTLQQNKY